MQPHVHFVGDVAEVAPTASGAAVIHLEAFHDAVGIDLDRLGVLPANIEHSRGVWVHHVRAQAVAQNF